MEDKMDLISQTGLLSALPPEEITRYLSDGSFKVTSYGKNNTVHFDGEVCLKLEIILKGKVVVERIDESGNLMTIAEFFDDDILGGNLLFSKNPRYPMTITAKHPTIILEINKERLFELFSDNHDFLRNYLEFVSDHAAILGDRIKHYVNRTIRDSIMSFLEYEGKRQNTHRVRFNMSKKALAERIGVQRTSLSRELARMRDEGLIVFDADHIELISKNGKR
ncbi:MAG: Crp/Fnr family transcriptional regulator [Clostridiales bacterium]|nr:Crp/Fnr family transcriptional regulator [Clostridiales bacterium]